MLHLRAECSIAIDHLDSFVFFGARELQESKSPTNRVYVHVIIFFYSSTVKQTSIRLKTNHFLLKHQMMPAPYFSLYIYTYMQYIYIYIYRERCMQLQHSKYVHSSCFATLFIFASFFVECLTLQSCSPQELCDWNTSVRATKNSWEKSCITCLLDCLRRFVFFEEMCLQEL